MNRNRIMNDIIEKQKKYQNREVPLIEVFRDAGISPICPHENTIDAGDEEHQSLFCVDCQTDLAHPEGQDLSNFCSECGVELDVKLEARDGGHYEEVAYCSGCGATATNMV